MPMGMPKTKSLNQSLHAAKAAKQEEFHTQYIDNKLGLKKLITTSYDDSPIAGQYTVFRKYDDGAVYIEDVKQTNRFGWHVARSR